MITGFVSDLRSALQQGSGTQAPTASVREALGPTVMLAAQPVAARVLVQQTAPVVDASAAVVAARTGVTVPAPASEAPQVAAAGIRAAAMQPVPAAPTPPAPRPPPAVVAPAIVPAGGGPSSAGAPFRHVPVDAEEQIIRSPVAVSGSASVDVPWFVWAGAAGAAAVAFYFWRKGKR